jgi:hypothetical protein
MLQAKQRPGLNDWYFQDDGRTRDDLSPMDQEIYDLRNKIDWSKGSEGLSDYLKSKKEVEERWNAPPPGPVDPADAQIVDSNLMERMKRMGGSLTGSFLTGQAATDTFLTNPLTLMAGK